MFNNFLKLNLFFYLFIISTSIFAEEIQHHGEKFTISSEILSKHRELIILVLNTESMDDDERQYWFDLMSSMTKTQIDRLSDILETEKRKLEELEKKYINDVETLEKARKIIKEQELNKGESRLEGVKEIDDGSLIKYYSSGEMEYEVHCSEKDCIYKKYTKDGHTSSEMVMSLISSNNSGNDLMIGKKVFYESGELGSFVKYKNNYEGATGRKNLKKIMLEMASAPDNNKNIFYEHKKYYKNKNLMFSIEFEDGVPVSGKMHEEDGKFKRDMTRADFKNKGYDIGKIIPPKEMSNEQIDSGKGVLIPLSK